MRTRPDAKSRRMADQAKREMTKRTVQPEDKYVVRFPDGLRDRLKEAAAANKRSMNAEIAFLLERSLQEKGPAEGATSPGQNHPPTHVRMEKMMPEHNTSACPEASGSAAAERMSTSGHELRMSAALRPAIESAADDSGRSVNAEICDLYRVRHLIEIVGDLLGGPFDATDVRRRYLQAATLVDFARGKLADTIHALEGGAQ